MLSIRQTALVGVLALGLAGFTGCNKNDTADTANPPADTANTSNEMGTDTTQKAVVGNEEPASSPTSPAW